MYMASDRLHFTLLLAIGLHGIVLLGLNLRPSIQPIITPPLALELVPGGDAQTQAGEQKTSTPKEEQRKVAQPSLEATPRNQSQPRASEQVTAKQPELNPPNSPRTPANPRPTLNLDPSRVVQQIAALDEQRRLELGDSRTRHLSNAGTLSSAESAYLAMWRRKCERIGSNNYPSGNLQGELTLNIVIHQSGQLLEVSLLRSSGHRALDEAALATVRQASPYQPFNVEMRKRYDRLSFTRTWQFSRRSTLIN
jgi:protein TonB